MRRRPLTPETPVEPTRDERLAYQRYAMGVVVSANRDWVERFPREPELGFTRSRLHAALLVAATAADLISDEEILEPLTTEEHCIRLYHRDPGWLRLRAHEIVTNAMNERIGEALART